MNLKIKSTHQSVFYICEKYKHFGKKKLKLEIYLILS